MVQSRPRRPPSCLQNTTTLYRHLTAAGSWEWYDHGHDGPLVFVEYNYIVPTPYSCRFLGVVRSRPRRPPSCLLEYNAIVPTPYSCRFLGVVRSRPRRPPSCLQNTNYKYRHLTDVRFLGVVRSRPRRGPSCLQNQLHPKNLQQLQVQCSCILRSRGRPSCLQNTYYIVPTPWTAVRCQVQCSCTITNTTAPLVFVEYNYIVPTPYSCRFGSMYVSRPRRPPSCLQNITTLYQEPASVGVGTMQYDSTNTTAPPRVCRIQLHCTDTLQLQVLGSSTITATTAPSCLQNTTTQYRQLQVLGSSTITATTAPLVFVEYNYVVPTPYSSRFLGVVRSRPRRPPSCLQNTTTLYRHLTAAGSWEQYDHGHDGGPSCLQNTTTLYRHLTAAGFWELYDHEHDGPLVSVEYNYIVPTPYCCRLLGMVRSRPRRPPSCLQKTTTLYQHLTAAGVLGMVQSRPRRPPSCLQNTTTLYRHLTAAGSWEWYDHGHDGPPRVCRIQLHCTHTLQIVLLPRTCICKVSVQCSCILQTRGGPSWP